MKQSGGRVSALISDQISRIFADWDRDDGPGCGVAVTRHGEVVYRRDFGMADLSSAIAIDSSSVFYVASLSKQFTATCILMMVADGVVTLDDRIDQYFPEFPD